MTALPIEGYAREYGSVAEMRAAHLARQIRLGRVVVAPVPLTEPEPEPAFDRVAHERAERERREAESWERVRKQYRLFFAAVPKGNKEHANRIMFEVSRETGVSVEAIKSERRSKPIARARQLAMWRVARETELSLPQIGQIFIRDHTTVLHAVRVMNEIMGEDVRNMGHVRPYVIPQRRAAAAKSRARAAA